MRAAGQEHEAEDKQNCDYARCSRCHPLATHSVRDGVGGGEEERGGEGGGGDAGCLQLCYFQALAPAEWDVSFSTRPHTYLHTRVHDISFQFLVTKGTPLEMINALEALNVRCLQLHVQIHTGTKRALYVVSC